MPGLNHIKKDKNDKKSEMWKHFDVDRANDGRKYSKMQLSVIVVPIIRSPIINDRQGKMSSTDGSDRQLNITDVNAIVCWCTVLYNRCFNLSQVYVSSY